jgi:hypothetical protein
VVAWVVVVEAVVVVVVGVVVVVEAVVVVVGVSHVGRVIESWIRVTSALRARSRPAMFAPFPTVMDVKAMIVPTKLEPDPRVAELVTCQKTLQAWAPLAST